MILSESNHVFILIYLYIDGILLSVNKPINQITDRTLFPRVQVCHWGMHRFSLERTLWYLEIYFYTNLNGVMGELLL